MKGKLSFYSFFLRLSIQNLLCICFYTFIQNEVQCYKMITCLSISFFNETKEHFTVETAISNMAAITASGNTHHDEHLPTTSLSTPELQKQPPPHLTTACKKATKTKKTKKQKLPAKKRKLSEVQEQSYDDVDCYVNKIGSFSPSRNPGLRIDRHSLCMKNTALDFFSLEFDRQLIQKIVRYTNEYVHITIMNKSTYADKDGAWVETTPAKIRKLTALLIYPGVVWVNIFKRYWSTKSLYHGL